MTLGILRELCVCVCVIFKKRAYVHHVCSCELQMNKFIVWLCIYQKQQITDKQQIEINCVQCQDKNNQMYSYESITRLYTFTNPFILWI